MFDTGTNAFGITQELANLLGTEDSDTIEFDMGDVHFKTPDFRIWTYLDKNDFIKSIIREEVPDFIYGGIIGNYPLLSEYYLIIDFNSRKLILEDPLVVDNQEVLQDSALYCTDFKWVNHMIFVQAIVNDTLIGYFHLDTGIPTHHFITLNAAKNAGCKLKYDELEKNHLTGIQCKSFKMAGYEWGVSNFLGQNMDYNVNPFGDYELDNIIGSLCNDNLNGAIIHLDFVNQKLILDLSKLSANP